MSTPPFDTATPNVARMYDYWLGGRDNFEADRQAAAAVRKIRPNVAEQALDNKRFQTRAVTYAAGFDLDAPACVVLACVLHFVDAGTARDVTSTFARMLARGSYLVISV